jgi:hypothetical protein
MNSKVTVTADESTGAVVIISKNSPDWGHIRLQQVKSVFDENGFVRRKPISALVHGTVSDLKSFNWIANKELEGKIVFKESLEPFNAKDPARDYKIAGKTKVVCCVDGQPVYRKTFYTLNTSTEDVVIAHNNTEDIKAAYANISEEVESDMTDL